MNRRGRGCLVCSVAIDDGDTGGVSSVSSTESHPSISTEIGEVGTTPPVGASSLGNEMGDIGVRSGRRPLVVVCAHTGDIGTLPPVCVHIDRDESLVSSRLRFRVIYASFYITI